MMKMPKSPNSDSLWTSSRLNPDTLNSYVTEKLSGKVEKTKTKTNNKINTPTPTLINKINCLRSIDATMKSPSKGKNCNNARKSGNVPAVAMRTITCKSASLKPSKRNPKDHLTQTSSSFESHTWTNIYCFKPDHSVCLFMFILNFRLSVSMNKKI